MKTDGKKEEVKTQRNTNCRQNESDSDHCDDNYNSFQLQQLNETERQFQAKKQGVLFFSLLK